MQDGFFRVLGPDEEQKFREWARENYSLGDEIREIWHPIVREECRKMIDDDLRFVQGLNVGQKW